MGRLVLHVAKGPAVIKTADGKIIEICQCGLSETKPFCDGSHSKVLDEREGATYVYDAAGNRVEVSEMFPTPRKVFVPP